MGSALKRGPIGSITSLTLAAQLGGVCMVQLPLDAAALFWTRWAPIWLTGFDGEKCDNVS